MTDCILFGSWQYTVIEFVTRDVASDGLYTVWHGDDSIRIHSIHDSSIGWVRLVGSLKLYVSFAEYSLFNRALLQERPIILRSLLSVTIHSIDDSYTLYRKLSISFFHFVSFSLRPRME